MTNFFSAALPEPNWASRLGASALPSVSCLGTSVPAAGPVTIAPPALPRLRVGAAARVSQAQQVAVTDPGAWIPVAPISLTVASRHCIGAIPSRYAGPVVVTRFLARLGT